jgi:hypothetical protein
MQIDKIYDAIIEVATNSANALPGGLGEPLRRPNLKALAEDLCDAFEVINRRAASWQQDQQ